MNLTLKVARVRNGKLQSAFVLSPKVAVTYEVGKVTKARHARLPLFALTPSELDDHAAYLNTGCGFDTIMVVSFAKRDVRKHLPDSYEDLQSHDLTVGKILKTLSKRNPRSERMGLMKCKVLATFPAAELGNFKTTKACLAHYRKLLTAKKKVAKTV